ncbi:MAG: hypothetical protein KDE64_02460 [Rhodocyclaceae bacterium]|nr:hypothetical protein [Rhodocyclaceae bacterium]
MMPPRFRALLFVASLLAAGAVHAQAEDSRALRREASALRDNAGATFARTRAACYDRFFVNACLDDARLEHTAQIKAARLLEARANRIDRGERIRAMEARLRKAEARRPDDPDTLTGSAPAQ